MLYPNIIEKEQLFEKGKEYKFPLKSIDYLLQTTLKTQETNRMIFVITKQPITYLKIKGESQLTDIEDILSWTYSIMPDQRKVEYLTLIIKK